MPRLERLHNVAVMADTKQPRNAANARWGAGIAVGLAIGVAIGVALGNIGAGIAIGAGIGVAFGFAFSESDKRGKEGPDGHDET